MRPSEATHSPLGAPPHEIDAAALREETTYGLLIQTRTDTAVELRHPDPTVLRGIHRSADGQTLHGTLATRAQVGLLRLLVVVDEKPHRILEAHVVPTKVEPETVTQMRDEVEGAVSGWTLRYLRATNTGAIPSVASTSNGGGWLRLVEAALDALEPALHHIAREPIATRSRTAKSTRVEAIRRPDAVVRRALRDNESAQRGHQAGTRHGRSERSAHDWVEVLLNVPRLPVSQGTASLDSPEHRWLRGGLVKARTELDALIAAESTSRPHARKQVHLDSLNKALRRTRALLRLNPIGAAMPGPLPAPSLRLRRSHHYRDAYEATRLLWHGLALGSGRLRVSLVDLAQLYEQWCFVTVAGALQRRLGAPRNAGGLASVEASGFRLRLRQGIAHALRFEGVQGTGVQGTGVQGTRAWLAYQPRFGPPALLPQRPDLLLTIERPGQGPRRFVLDAKYRRDDSAATVRRYGQPAPPRGAIADLHRYRDAIRNTDGARIIDQAVALYPLVSGDTEVGKGRLWQSIEDLGVGALPLLPQATQHLDAWLRQVLDA
ncbi:MAG: DUF2357 domain-containing protein [Bacteroidota bacterium]